MENIKVEQDEVREVLGEEYIDYNLVMATTFGNPIGTGAIRGQLKKLIEEHNLPPVAFEKLDIIRITGLVYEPNIASRKVLEKNNFILEGVMKKAVIKNNNIYDLCIYGKVR